jgi:enamine deaminase RidA (YjgF/YER057c/UK114 family)
MKIEEKIKSLGLVLPPAPPPAGNYIGAVTYGKLVYLSGHGPVDSEGNYRKGKVPNKVSLDEAYEAARLVGLNMLTTLKNEIGDLDRVRRFVKVLGMVNAAPDFEQQPHVINGFSDMMVEIFGEAGCCARSAVGMGSLPFQIPVEIEAIVELK